MYIFIYLDVPVICLRHSGLGDNPPWLHLMPSLLGVLPLRMLANWIKNIDTLTYFHVITAPVSERCNCFIIDINECAPQPCLNSGTCRDQVGTYVCECQPGFTGLKCETGECKTEFMKNNSSIFRALKPSTSTT